MKKTLCAAGSLLVGALPAFAHHEETVAFSGTNQALLAIVIVGALAVSAVAIARNKNRRVKD